jgi:hypothetical protein
VLAVLPPHLWHLAAVIAVPAVIIAAFSWYDRMVDRRDAAGVPAPTLPRGRIGVAAASAAAGLVHAVVCPEHFREAASFGLFFAAAAGAQVAWAVLVLRRPSRALWWAGAAGNASVVALWAVTRTVGLPVGPDRGAAEAVGRADVLACVLELVVVFVSLRALLAVPSVGRRAPDSVRAA